MANEDDLLWLMGRGRGKYEGCVARKPDSKGVLTDLTSPLGEVGRGGATCEKDLRVLILLCSKVEKIRRTR